METVYLKKIEGEDYRFIDEIDLLELFKIETGEMSPIELLGDNIYKGIIYCYGKTNISEGEDDMGFLQFQFKILNRNEKEKSILGKDSVFIQHLGEILNSIIIDDLEYSV